MFKSVEYVGFEGRDDRRRLAEAAQTALAGVVGSFRDEVVVEWQDHPDPGADAVELTLSLRLPTASGSARSFIPLDDLTKAAVVRRRCRDVWGRLLDTLIEQQANRLNEYLREPVEV